MSNLVPDYEMPGRIQQIALERTKLHIHAHLGGIAPMFERNAEVHFVRQVDMYGQQFALTLETACLKGEMTDEQRTREFTHVFPVFATWLDHLKYSINEGRILGWLPKKWRNFTVRYQNVTHKRSETFPVKVTRVCPHATFDWDRDARQHIMYLFPALGEEK